MLNLKSLVLNERLRLKSLWQYKSPLDRLDSTSLAAVWEKLNAKNLGSSCHTNHSRNVNKFVCSIFIARSASLSSITQEILISLAPGKVSGLNGFQFGHTHPAISSQCSRCSLPEWKTSSLLCQPYSSSVSQPNSK